MRGGSSAALPRHYGLGIVCGFLALGTILVGKRACRTTGAAARDPRQSGSSARSSDATCFCPACASSIARTRTSAGCIRRRRCSLDDPGALIWRWRRRHPLTSGPAAASAAWITCFSATPLDGEQRQSSYSGATFREPSSPRAILTRTSPTASRRSPPRAAARAGATSTAVRSSASPRRRSGNRSRSAGAASTRA